MDSPAGVITSELQSLLPGDVSPELIFAVQPLRLADILDQVSAFYAIPIAQITDRHIRGEGISLARHVACYLARTMTRFSHWQIATHLGGFDMTISTHGFKRLSRLRTENEIIRDDLDVLRLRLINAALLRCEASCH
jgi:chromosomal replication initiation ATPase DnaA